MNGGAFLAFLAGLVGAILVGVLINLATKEAEAWLDVLPGWLLRLARRRLPASHRVDLYGEWAAELHMALHNTEGRPISRLVLGIRYSIGLLRTARKIADELGPTRIGRVADSIPLTDMEQLDPLGLPTWLEWDREIEKQLGVNGANHHPRVQEIRRAWRLLDEQIRKQAIEADVGCRSWRRCLRRLQRVTGDQRWAVILVKANRLAEIRAMCGGHRAQNKWFSDGIINVPTDSTVEFYLTAVEMLRSDIHSLRW